VTLLGGTPAKVMGVAAGVVLAATELSKELSDAALLVGSTCGQPANRDVRTKSPVSRASVGNCANLGINPPCLGPCRVPITSSGRGIGAAKCTAYSLCSQLPLYLGSPCRLIYALDRSRGIPVLRRVCRSRWRQLITFQRMMPYVGIHGHCLQSPIVPSQHAHLCSNC